MKSVFNCTLLLDQPIQSDIHFHTDLGYSDKKITKA